MRDDATRSISVERKKELQCCGVCARTIDRSPPLYAPSIFSPRVRWGVVVVVCCVYRYLRDVKLDCTCERTKTAVCDVRCAGEVGVYSGGL